MGVVVYFIYFFVIEFVRGSRGGSGSVFIFFILQMDDMLSKIVGEQPFLKVT